MQPEQESYFRNVLHLSDEIQLAGVEFQLSEKINRREKETAGYPLTGFLADTGGALGLFLGLSLLQIFSWCGNIWKILTRWAALVQIYTSKFRKVNLSLCQNFFLSNNQWKLFQLSTYSSTRRKIKPRFSTSRTSGDGCSISTVTHSDNTSDKLNVKDRMLWNINWILSNVFLLTT